MIGPEPRAMGRGIAIPSAAQDKLCEFGCLHPLAIQSGLRHQDSNKD
jgi:hypothetical protein